MIQFGLGRRICGDAAGAINFNGRHQTCLSAGARSGVRQRVGRGRGRPKAASVLSARWRLGAVNTFIDISPLQWLRCTLLIIICFLSRIVSRPTTRCHKSQFDFQVSVTVIETGHGLHNRLSGSRFTSLQKSAARKKSNSRKWYRGKCNCSD